MPEKRGGDAGERPNDGDEPRHYLLDSDDYRRDLVPVFSEAVPVASAVRVELDESCLDGAYGEDDIERCVEALTTVEALDPERPDDGTRVFPLDRDGEDALFALLDVATTMVGENFVFRLTLLDDRGDDLLTTIPHESMLWGESPPLPEGTVASVQELLADRVGLFVASTVHERWETDDHAYRFDTTAIVQSTLDERRSRTHCSALSARGLDVVDGTTLVFDTPTGEKVVPCVTRERAERVANTVRSLRWRYDGTRL
ncbi:hypothetical protein C454_14400 [Haloferax gibbonsii ATCC 33959]|uniref:Uncharacterized protein n=1 Tax=Haloferax gibbonsii (strain ATCC 33959 / DSM 4427 / JCM 8863 / NBRC 102184 / NCIMB 2188 / Ma 2.38) TaxID=1227459 RepID=M0H1Q1_HALGM|nr:hypothetical protein [Haloferax gibbonsii]ELZ77692.1 hypothetical protein C454_14400 [Haloferax gibbonsii ATCC 33959]